MIRKLFVVLQVLLCASILKAQDDLGPTMLDLAYTPALPAGGIAAVEPYQIPASYWPALIDLPSIPDVTGKTLHPWPTDLQVLRVPGNLVPLRNIARIMGAIGVGDKSQGYTDEDMLLANDIALAAGVGVVLHTSPYHRVRWCNDDPLDWSDTGDEIAFTARFFQKAKVLGLRVTCVVMDSECYDEAHESVDRRLDMMSELAKGFFGEDVLVIRYRTGDYEANLFARNYGNQSFIQYRIYSAAYTERWLDRWEVKLPVQYQIPLEDSWSVWTALGPGYRDGGWEWKLGLDEAEHRHLARAHMVDDRITDIIVYPHPCRPIAMPEGIEAFIAYAMGATER